MVGPRVLRSPSRLETTRDPQEVGVKTAAVVIVSSDVDIQDLYVLAMRSSRRAAYGTISAGETIALAHDIAIGAIVVDIRGGADWEICRRLHADSLTRGIPVVALSGNVADDGRYRRTPRNQGAQHLLRSQPSLRCSRAS
jgi:CheY-like chemotaxis protein